MKRAAGADRRGHRPAGKRRRDLSSRWTRTRPSRLGINSRDVDNALYNGFGQRQVATIYDELNQYRVILGVAPQYTRSPEALKRHLRAGARHGRHRRHAAQLGGERNRHHGHAAVRPPPRPAPAPVNPGLRDQATGQAVSSRATTMVPLSAIARFSRAAHRQLGQSTRTPSSPPPSRTTWPTGRPSATAQAAVRQAEAEIGMPINVRGSFQGTARGGAGVAGSSSRC